MPPGSSLRKPQNQRRRSARDDDAARYVVVGDVDSVYDLDKKTREELAEIKQQLPDRLTALIPRQVRDSARLIHLCRNLIAANPGDRFRNADRAISDGTHVFQSELHNAKPTLVVFYAEYMERWVKSMKRTEAANPATK